MNKVNPLLVFTGLALVALAALAGLTYDRWSPQASGPETLLAEAQSNAPEKNAAADTTQQDNESSKTAAAPAEVAADSREASSGDQQVVENKADSPGADNTVTAQPETQATADQEIAETAPDAADDGAPDTATDDAAQNKTAAGNDTSAPEPANEPPKPVAEASPGSDDATAMTGGGPHSQADSSQEPTKLAPQPDAAAQQDQAMAGSQADAPADEPSAEQASKDQAGAGSEPKQEASENAPPPEPETPAADTGSDMKLAEAPATGQDLPEERSKPADPAASAPETGKTDQGIAKDTSPPASANDKKPSFDTVRVETTGEAVTAGQAAPGSEVTLLLDGKPVGTATANPDGSWIVIPDKPLDSGAGALSVEQQLADGTTVESEQTIAVLVPPKADAKSDKKPMVALVEPDQPVRILQTPQPEKPAAISGKVALDSIDYNDDGDILFSGRADAGTAVRLYIDNKAKGDAVADASGRWSFTGREDIAAGNHALRVDRIDIGGKVVSRIELPFVREEASKAAAIVAAPQVALGKPDEKPVRKQDSASAPPEPKTAANEAPPASGEVETSPAAANGENNVAPPPEKSDQPSAAAPETGNADAAPPPLPRVAQDLAANAPEVATPAEDAAAIPKHSAEAEVAAAAPAAEPETAREGHIVIQPGNNLWKLSRVIYGRGTHYTVIYEANKDQIRSPGRIYPGQIFATPNATPPDKIDPKRKTPLTPEEGGTTLP